MKRDSFSGLAIVLFTAILAAQVSPQAGVPNSTTQAPPATELAPGTILSVELSKSLDAKKVKANDKFEARTVVDLLSHGQILIPRNTKIIGHITEVKVNSKQSPGAMVGVVFDKALMSKGREVPLHAAIQAVARPLQTTPAFPADDPMSPTATGIPSASQSQRGAITGSVSTGPQFPSQGGYPPGGGSGVPPDSGGTPASTVSPLGPTSKGVVGIKGLSLDSSGPASVISSKTDNVRLESGAQLILRVQ